MSVCLAACLSALMEPTCGVICKYDVTLWVFLHCGVNPRLQRVSDATI